MMPLYQGESLGARVGSRRRPLEVQVQRKMNFDTVVSLSVWYNYVYVQHIIRWKQIGMEVGKCRFEKRKGSICNILFLDVNLDIN